ncbi:MAG: pseudouridylate synthase [Wenzhouxiangella sp.]|nr:pseudouridylate synthase [Wenzhouxiangella sp.]TVR91535.1 MAG: pseudouridylate synthase [Wenzhouxiangellaceae bacterium]
MPIVYRDDWLCAIDKPCGLMVHRSSRGTDKRFAMQLLRDQLGQRVFPIHRLDRATSGLLLFALDADSAAHLGEQMMARTVTKRYLAVVRGHVDDEGLIDHPLAPDGKGLGKEAKTNYRSLARIELPFAVGRYPSSRYSLVMAQPETGRMHQIRRHFKHIFHPVIGDTTYGEGRHNRLFRQFFGCHRLLLHAQELSFQHPADQRSMTLTVQPDGEFQRVIERFRVSPGAQIQSLRYHRNLTD